MRRREKKERRELENNNYQESDGLKGRAKQIVHFYIFSSLGCKHNG